MNEEYLAKQFVNNLLSREIYPREVEDYLRDEGVRVPRAIFEEVCYQIQDLIFKLKVELDK